MTDTIRPVSDQAIAMVQSAVRAPMLPGGKRKPLTGWHQGLDEAIAEVLPDPKSDKVKDFQIGQVAYGVNDAPALEFG